MRSGLLHQSRVSRARLRARRPWAGAALVACLVLGAGCAVDTGRLTPEQTRRLEAEGIVHRAANLVIRRTHGFDKLVPESCRFTVISLPMADEGFVVALDIRSGVQRG